MIAGMTICRPAATWFLKYKILTAINTCVGMYMYVWSYGSCKYFYNLLKIFQIIWNHFDKASTTFSDSSEIFNTGRQEEVLTRNIKKQWCLVSVAIFRFEVVIYLHAVSIYRHFVSIYRRGVRLQDSGNWSPNSGN
jgi:hypothetical protein